MLRTVDEFRTANWQKIKRELNKSSALGSLLELQLQN